MRTRRWLLAAGLCAALAVGTGCAKSHSGTAPRAGSATTSSGASTAKPKPIVTPAAGLAGKVASVNPGYQFVVIAFEGGQPVPDQKLAVYRANLKVGEVKISPQQMGRNVVADVLTGDVRVGDDVRPE